MEKKEEREKPYHGRKETLSAEEKEMIFENKMHQEGYIPKSVDCIRSLRVFSKSFKIFLKKWMQVHIALRYLREVTCYQDSCKIFFFFNLPILNSRKTRKAVSYIPQKNL